MANAFPEIKLINVTELENKLSNIGDALRERKSLVDIKWSIDGMPEVIRTLSDTSKDTVATSNMLSGITAHDASGNLITGNISTVARAATTMSVTADDTNDTLKFTGANNQSSGYLASGGSRSASSTATLTISKYSEDTVRATVTESASNKSISKDFKVSYGELKVPSVSYDTGTITSAANSSTAFKISVSNSVNTPGYVNANSAKYTNGIGAAAVVRGSSSRQLSLTLPSAGTYAIYFFSTKGRSDYYTSNVENASKGAYGVGTISVTSGSNNTSSEFTLTNPIIDDQINAGGPSYGGNTCKYQSTGLTVSMQFKYIDGSGITTWYNVGWLDHYHLVAIRTA